MDNGSFIFLLETTLLSLRRSHEAMNNTPSCKLAKTDAKSILILKHVNLLPSTSKIVSAPTPQPRPWSGFWIPNRMHGCAATDKCVIYSEKTISGCFQDSFHSSSSLTENNLVQTAELFQQINTLIFAFQS
jgi:hypothetical protein